MSRTEAAPSDVCASFRASSSGVVEAEGRGAEGREAEGRGAEGREAQGSVSVEEARPWRRERSRLTTCEMEEVRSAETKPRSQSREPEVYRGK